MFTVAVRMMVGQAMWHADLSLHRLRMLLELHRRGTVTATAAALHYTASAVSQQLAQLERDVGTKLIERLGRRVQLTDMGVLLAGHASEILGAAERASMALEEAQETISARLTVGVFATVAAGLLPPMLTRLATQQPGITIRTKEMPPESTAAAVRDGRLDLAFVIDYADAPMPWESSLHGVVIATERLHAAVPAGAVPAGSISLSELAEHSWILSGTQTHFGYAVREACHRSGFTPPIRHEVDEQATAMAMVAAGLGVTLVSDLGLSFRPADVDIVALTSPISRTVSMAARASALHRPASNLVIEAVRSTAAELGLGVADTAIRPPARPGNE